MDFLSEPDVHPSFPELEDPGFWQSITGDMIPEQTFRHPTLHQEPYPAIPESNTVESWGVALPLVEQATVTFSSAEDLFPPAYTSVSEPAMTQRSPFLPAFAAQSSRTRPGSALWFASVILLLVGFLLLVPHHTPGAQSAASSSLSERRTAQEVQTATITLPPMEIPDSPYVDIARQDAIDAGISPVYFVRQINQESGFNPHDLSPAGAEGIAQFMPSTAAGLGIDPWDPIQALRGAAQLMARHLRYYDGDEAKALAAYNAGRGRVASAVNGCGADHWLDCLPGETRHYIYRIMGI